jgi:hypothetical protein
MLLLPVLLTACVGTIGTRSVATQLDPATPTRVEWPAKVHLADGSVVIYERGFILGPDRIRGIGSPGNRWGLTLANEGRVDQLSVDSVALIVIYKKKTNWLEGDEIFCPICANQ